MKWCDEIIGNQTDHGSVIRKSKAKKGNKYLIVFFYF